MATIRAFGRDFRLQNGLEYQNPHSVACGHGPAARFLILWLVKGEKADAKNNDS